MIPCTKKMILLRLKNGDTLHYKLAKNALEAPMEYTAEDSMVLTFRKNSNALWKKSHYSL